MNVITFDRPLTSISLPHLDVVSRHLILLLLRLLRLQRPKRRRRGRDAIAMRKGLLLLLLLLLRGRNFFVEIFGIGGTGRAH
jgi:hypothetical protein